MRVYKVMLDTLCGINCVHSLKCYTLHRRSLKTSDFRLQRNFTSFCKMELVVFQTFDAHSQQFCPLFILLSPSHWLSPVKVGLASEIKLWRTRVAGLSARHTGHRSGIPSTVPERVELLSVKIPFLTSTL